ncbi:MAG: AAA family ATPase [Anaerotignum sp.]|nr:AAA family ATPase [Anaerotignum sp.]
MSYEFNKQDVFDFADTIQTEKHTKGRELFFRECPYCRGGNKHDKDTFSINLDNGTFYCFRSGCGKSGHFVQLARDFGFQLDFGEGRQYKPLPQKKVESKPAAVEYMESRGISKAVTERYNITVQTKNPHVLVFPFYDENGVMQFVKYRNTKFNGTGNKEWAEKDAKPILFGMQQCKDFETLIITEGQIDSLSVAECGFDNVVSVPNGARGFTWYQHCADWLNQFKEIIVFGDNEHGHITLVKELQARVKQRLKVVRVVDYLGEKDANDILKRYGKQAIIDAIYNAELPKLDNVLDIADIKPVDMSALPKIKTGITPLDRLVGGLYYGQVTLLSGRRGEGKSTLASQIIAEALNQDMRIFAYSGELPGYHFRSWLDFQLAGKSNLEECTNEYGDIEYKIPADVQSKIGEWYRGRAFLYDNTFVPSRKEETETLLQTIEKVIRQYDVRLIVIDNLMTAMDATDDNLYGSQSEFVGSLKKIAETFDVHVILVAHPKKTKEQVMGNDDVSGSGDITNRVDVVIYFNRVESGSSHITITKNRVTGKLTGNNPIIVEYSRSSKRITSVVDSVNKSYGWEAKDVPEGFEAVQEDEPCPF